MWKGGNTNHPQCCVGRPGTMTVLLLLVAAGPLRVTAAGSHRLVYVPSTVYMAPVPARVYVIDTASNTVVGTISLPAVAAAAQMAFTPDGRTAYITNPDEDQFTNNNAVSVVDTATYAVRATIPVPGGAASVAMSPNGSRAYVTAGSPVSVIDTKTDTVTDTIPVPCAAVRIVAAPDGRRVYGTCDLTLDPEGNAVGVVWVMDTSSNTVIDTIEVGQNAGATALTHDGRLLYIGRQYFQWDPNFPDPVTVVDTATNSVVATVPAEDPSDAFYNAALTPDDRFLYLINTGRSAVSVLDTATNTFVKTFATQGGGTGPFGVATSPDGALAYVTDTYYAPVGNGSSQGTVSVIDTASNAITKTIMRVGTAIGRPAVADLEPLCGNGVLDTDEECDDGNLVGGDGCAPNCTLESRRTLILDPGVSKLAILTASATYSAPVRGSITLSTGKRNNDESIPVAVRAEDVHLDPIPIPALGCVCLQATPDPDLAPGVTGHADIGCAVGTIPPWSIPNVAYTNNGVHDSRSFDRDCFRGTQEPPTSLHPGACNRHNVFFYNPGPPGSSVLETNIRMRIIADGGTCAVDASDPPKGADGIPCNGDDPDAFTGALLGPLTTAAPPSGGAEGAVKDLDGNSVHTFIPGAAFECDALAADPTGGVGGVVFVSVTPVIDGPIGDFLITTVFAAEPVRTATPTRSATPTQTETATPSSTPTAVPSATPTITFTASVTPTATVIPTGTSTATATPDPTATMTPSPSQTPSPTTTPTRSPTATPTITATVAPTNTPTPTAPATATQTRTPSPTRAAVSDDGDCSITPGQRSGAWQLLLPVALLCLGRFRLRRDS
jgi:cysteine-rich repeat protein/YVTN family beta-propeller protein